MKSDVSVKAEPEETVRDCDLNSFNRKISLSEENRCDLCEKKFTRKDSFMNHKKYLCGKVEEQYTCDLCKKGFTKKYTLLEHIKTHSEKYGCDLCKGMFNSKETLGRHKE